MASSSGTELGLLRGFRLAHDGEPVVVPLAAQRVVAFLALHDRPMLRTSVAGALWQETSEQRAAANLRSALWRINQAGLSLVQANVSSLALAPHVGVDLHRVEDLAHGVLDRRIQCEDVERPTRWFSGDFLPDWPDDWALVERERFRQLRLHALEALCDQLTGLGRFGQAVEAGLAAVAGEPLRESAHRGVIRAYLAEGNQGEALRQYELYRRLAYRELRVAPSAEMRALFADQAPGLRAAVGLGGTRG